MCPAPRRPRGTFWRVRPVAMGVALITIAAAIAWTYRDRPGALYRQAQDVFATRPGEAARLLEEAVALSGDDYPEAQLLWTRALLRAGQRDEALGCFSLISAPSALNAEELLLLADEASGAGMPLLALWTLQAIPGNSPHRVAAIERLLTLQHGIDDSWTVAALAEEWAALETTRSDPWLLLGQAYEQLQDPPRAAAAYERFLTLEASPEQRVFALRQLLRLSLGLGDRAAARRLQAELLEIVPPSITDEVQGAALRRLEGDLDGAWSAVHKLLAREPGLLPAVELRGALAFDRQEFAAAERDFRHVLNDQPWNKAAHYRLAQTLQRVGRAEEARRHFDENRRLTELSLRVLELQSRTDSGAAEIDRLTELSAAYEALGQLDAAARLRARIEQWTRSGQR